MWDANAIRWRKSSRSDSSGGACVEVGSFVPVTAAQWQMSSHSDSSGAECVEIASVIQGPDQWRENRRSTGIGGACVEVAESAAVVAVRDSKDPDGPKLVFGLDAWQAFANHVKGGKLDLS